MRLASGETLIRSPSSVGRLGAAGSAGGWEGGGASGALGAAAAGGEAWALAGAAEASPMVAIGAPIFAGTPCSTRIESTPPLSASRSNVALSDSTSASTSPAFTSSPVFFFHSTMVPSSIVSESFGMLTSGIDLLPHDDTDELLDVLARRD